MKATPIDDHRVLCYVEHVTLLLLHQEISEKRLNALYATARGWVVEEEQEIEEWDDDEGEILDSEEREDGED
jgi:hypothetical protein